MTDEPEKPIKKSGRLFDVFEDPEVYAVVKIAGGLWLLCFAVASLSALAGNIGGAGQFGDTFGVVNALFTMLAMIGAAVAVYFQHNELVESREREAASKLEREAEKRDALKDREAEKREQRFFQLLVLVNQAANECRVRDSSSGPFAGNEVFEKIANDYKRGLTIDSEMLACDQWAQSCIVILKFIRMAEENEQRSFFQAIFVSQLSTSQRNVLSIIANRTDPQLKSILRGLGVYQDEVESASR